MSIRTITKAQLKDSYFIVVDYDQVMSESITDSFKRNSSAPVHDDLVAAFRNLNLHLALIFDEISEKEFDDALSGIQPEESDEKPVRRNLFGVEPELPISEKYVVNGFEIKGVGDNQGVILRGTKLLKSGNLGSISTPLTKWTDTYARIDHLSEAVDILTDEIQQFLNGKIAPPKQQSLEFDQASEDSDDEPQF